MLCRKLAYIECMEAVFLNGALKCILFSLSQSKEGISLEERVLNSVQLNLKSR